MPTIAKGKTKLILSIDGFEHEVYIQSNSDVTAGDGEVRDTVDGKAVYATATTSNIFRVLNALQIPNHFLAEVESDTFRARKCHMVPIECVARRIATGSYLKRNPDVEEGFIFEEPLVEFFYKDDKRHDPMMNWDGRNGKWELFNASSPNDGVMYSVSVSAGNREIDFRTANKMEVITKEVFMAVEAAWSNLGVALVDFKIEFGFDTETGELLVADVIDNDSWRIWPAGDKSQDKSKQVYRDSENRSPKDLGQIGKNYQWVAEQTKKML